MTARLVSTLLLGVAVTSACGGPSAPPAPRADIAALEARAGMTGCTTVEPTLAVATAHCTFSTELLTIATFATDEQRDLWARANKAATGGVIVKGDGWSAVVIDPQVSADLAAALGGTVQ